jgi:TPR repeat protein/predicted Ser/Thr protein kinase
MSAEKNRADEATTVGPAESAASPGGSRFPIGLPAPFGRYRVLKLLGKGGMGSVYLAHDNQLDRPVALKIPLLEAGEQSQVLARFFREARSAAALHHPNICPVHDVGAVDGVPYLTMAFIEGKSLSALARAQPLSPRQSALLVRKLALALEEAHKRGVIHRDLKPANIMIDKRGEPVIMDFGLARRVRKGDPRLTRMGELMGTPAYMPPEQVAGDIDVMGPASDIYSMGVILYELLAGRLPFTGEPMAMLSQVLMDEPPPPSQFRPDLDPELEAICLKALAKRVADRHASMAVLATVLTDHLLGKSVAAEPARGQRDTHTAAPRTGRSAKHRRREERTANDRPRRRSRRARDGIPQWWIIAGSAGMLLLLVLVVGALVWVNRSRREVAVEGGLKQKKDQAGPVSHNLNPEIYNSVSLNQLKDALLTNPNGARLLARIGWIYENGRGVDTNKEEAARWYRQAADLGDRAAQSSLGKMSYFGQGVKRDSREAFRWFRQAAEQNDADAQNWLGVLYTNGEGVDKNETEAVGWYSKAAEQGDAMAQYNLGWMYTNGRGVARDYATAVSWYRKAAMQGNPWGQYSLGEMYEHGKGVARDLNEARKWYEMAAEQGNEDARKRLDALK